MTTTTAYSYDVNDRLLTEASDGVETRYTYDDNGNPLTKTVGADVVEYEYDDANRLAEMRKVGLDAPGSKTGSLGGVGVVMN